MKKILLLFIAMTLAITMTGCGNTKEKENENKQQNNQVDVLKNPIESIEELETTISNDVEQVILNLTKEYTALKEKITNYDEYMEKEQNVEGFYDKVVEDVEELNTRILKYSVNYAELIINSGEDYDDIYDNLDDLKDFIYDDTLEDVKDEIYDGILEDIKDDFYDGVIEDARDSVKYSDWLDTRSNEYKMWLDTRSDVYSNWLDTRSDIYSFWLELRSDMYNDEIEDAKEEIQDFKEDLLSTSSNNTESNDNNSINESNNSSTNETNNTNLSDDFKKAMDDYEKFMDEYISFMKKYSNSNGTDTELLKDYSIYMTKYLEMVDSFGKWEKEDLNDAETKYYIEVQTRVNKKLLDASI